MWNTGNVKQHPVVYIPVETLLHNERSNTTSELQLKAI